MKYLILLAAVATWASTASAAVVDELDCEVKLIFDNGAAPVSTQAKLAVLRRSLSDSPGPEYRKTSGRGSLELAGQWNNFRSFTIHINYTHLMQVDAAGKVIKAGQQGCLNHYVEYDDHGSGAACGVFFDDPENPFYGYNLVPIVQGEPGFHPGTLLPVAVDITGVGKVQGSCEYKGTSF